MSSLLTDMLMEARRPDVQAVATLNESVLAGLGGGPTASGMPVSTETAFKISTFWACAGLISDCLGMLPLVVNERLGENERRRATDHPLYDVLHDQPNERQTAMDFRSQLTLYAIARGNGRAKIRPGVRGPVDQLDPIHPDNIRTEKIRGGGTRYVVTEENGAQQPYNDEDIFDVRGMSLDGFNGMSVISYARESFGLALAGERAGSKSLRNGSRISGVLQVKGKLSDPAQKRMRASWQETYGGVENDGKVAVLEEGTEFKGVSMTMKDAQWLESREFQAEDICRWLRVPPHMVGLTSKATSWGSGIEQMGIGFVTYTLMPWLVRWQQAIGRDLIIATRKYFAEFVVDALLRGDALSRYNVYRIGRDIGVLSPNDIRRLENMNPRQDPDGDAYVTPLNMQPSNVPTDGNTGAHYDALLIESAGRVVRKEMAALNKAAGKGGLMEAAGEFYSDHADFVAQVMQIPVTYAQMYIREQLGDLAAHGEAAMEDWETRRVADLVNLAKESH